ncbi:MAG: BatA domain-containing protein [Lacipirellulaceae bacterium]
MNPVVAAGFASLATLGWVAMAAAPILIHLWMRQAHRETPWAAVRFLRVAIERQARRLRLEQWILLALRTSLLLLVALAAAKPYLGGSPLGAGAPRHRIVALDASASMGMTRDGESRLDRAKKLVEGLVDRAVSGDQWSLCVLSSQPSAPIPRPTTDRGAFRRAVQGVATTQGVANVPRLLTLVERTLGQESKQGPPREVLVFTDLGANSWRAVAKQHAGAPSEAGSADADSTNGAADDARRTSVDRVAALARLSIIDVGDRAASNAAVTRLATSGSLPTAGRPVEVTADLSLLGPGQAREATAELVVDGLPVAQQRVRLAPGGATPVVFAPSIESPGLHELSVRIDGDDTLAIDNRRWLALDLRDKVRVLCVEGARDAAAYVADALDPLDSNDGPIEAVVASDADLPSLDFERFACVVFCNVAELTAADASRLTAYVEQGGGAIFFLGDRVDPDRYNGLLTQGANDQASRTRRTPFRLVSNAASSKSNEPRPLLPMTLGPAVSEPTYRIDPLEYAHPIVAPFRGRERSGLLTIPVLRRFPLRIDAQGLAAGRVVVALALDGGAPLLVTVDRGLGRLAVVSTDGSLASLDPATGEPWTALPAWPSFLPIVRGTVEYVSQGLGSTAPKLVDEPLGGRLPSGAFSADSVRVVRPDGARESAQGGADALLWSYPRSDAAGVYRVVVGDAGPAAGVAALAVNIDPSESDPTPLDAGLLPAEFRVEAASATLGVSESIADAGRSDLARWLLTLALGLLLTEGAVACWFGRRGA